MTATLEKVRSASPERLADVEEAARLNEEKIETARTNLVWAYLAAELENREMRGDPSEVAEALACLDWTCQDLENAAAEQRKILAAWETVQREPEVIKASQAAAAAIESHRAKFAKIEQERRRELAELQRAEAAVLDDLTKVEWAKSTIVELNKLPPSVLRREKQLINYGKELAAQVRVLGDKKKHHQDLADSAQRGLWAAKDNPRPDEAELKSLTQQREFELQNVAGIVSQISTIQSRLDETNFELAEIAKSRTVPRLPDGVTWPIKSKGAKR